jgi:hypothetical protein
LLLRMVSVVRGCDSRCSTSPGPRGGTLSKIDHRPDCSPTSSTNKTIEAGGEYTSERFGDGESVCWAWDYGTSEPGRWCRESKTWTIRITGDSSCKA